MLCHHPNMPSHTTLVVCEPEVNSVVVSLESQLRQTAEAADRQTVILERQTADAVSSGPEGECCLENNRTELKSHMTQYLHLHQGVQELAPEAFDTPASVFS